MFQQKHEILTPRNFAPIRYFVLAVSTVLFSQFLSSLFLQTCKCSQTLHNNSLHSMHTMGYAFKSHLLVCVCLWSTKKVCLHTYQSSIFVKMVHTACSSTLCCQWYLLVIPGTLVPMFLFTQLFLWASRGSFKTSRSANLDIATPIVRCNRNAGKANLNVKVVYWCYSTELLVQHNPLTVLSAHKVCVLWNQLLTCSCLSSSPIQSNSTQTPGRFDHEVVSQRSRISLYLGQ